MKAGNLLLVAFGAVALAQVGVPLAMIAGQERILAEGRAYRFRTAPVDPYDAFRGRYVALGFTVPVATVINRVFRPGQRVYAVLAEDEDGFVRVADVLDAMPADGLALRVKLRDMKGSVPRLEFPFDRYYMGEHAAPAAEEAYRQHSRSGTNDAWAVVRVYRGRAALESLYVGGQRIEDLQYR